MPGRADKGLDRNLDWAAFLKAGVQSAGLRPHEVWALTPFELSLVLGLDGEGAAPFTRARLLELDALYGGAQGGGDE